MKIQILLAAVFLLTWVGVVYADDELPDDRYVSREEYEKLKSDFESVVESLKAELQDLKKGLGTEQAQKDKTIEALRTDVETMKQQRAPAVADLQAELQSVRELAEQSVAGSSKFLIAGYGTAGFTDREGEDSTFSASVNPLFLWKLGDNILFESELEFEVEKEDVGEAETHVGLEYANVSIILNDYVTVGAGKFLTPFAIFSERLHPTWINKLPDFPLPYGSHRIAPMSSVGVFVRGGISVKSTKFNYAFYASNGPTLFTEDPAKAGSLDFKDFEDLNNNKAAGGRVGFLPIPEIEVAYSFQFGRSDPEEFGQDVDILLQALDFSYVRYLESLGGILDIRVEWIWSNVEDAVFDPNGTEGFGPLTFDNDRHGGWVQVAYRPSGDSNELIRNLEFVVRWDYLDLPNDAPEDLEERQRWTWGINYWIYPSTVFKIAYQLDDRVGEEDANALLLQLATGF